MLTALLVPVSGLVLALAVLTGGRPAQIMAILSAIGFGFAALLVLIGA